MKNIITLLAAMLIIACQAEKTPFSPKSQDDSKAEPSNNKDTLNLSAGGIIFDDEFYVAVVNAKGEDVFTKIQQGYPKFYIMKDGVKTAYTPERDGTPYPNGYMRSEPTDTSYGIYQIMGHASELPTPQEISDTEAICTGTCFIQFTPTDQDEIVYQIKMRNKKSKTYSIHYLVKLTVNGELIYDCTDPGKPLINAGLKKLTRQECGYVKVLK